jgi:hypothetical protein
MEKNFKLFFSKQHLYLSLSHTQREREREGWNNYLAKSGP